MVRVRMPAGVMGVVLSGALLAGCGSSKISDSSFIGACVKKFGVSSSQCHCLQQKVVAAGHGNIDYSANTLPPADLQAIHTAAVACGFSPPAPSGGGTGTST